MDFLSQVFSIQTVVFGLAIYAIVLFMRKILEGFFPQLLDGTNKLGHLYSSTFLYSMPASVGGSLGLIFSSYPYPEQFISQGSHFLFGVGMGLISGMVFKYVKKGIQLTTNNLPVAGTTLTTTKIEANIVASDPEQVDSSIQNATKED